MQKKRNCIFSSPIISDGRKQGKYRSYPLEYKLLIVEEAKRSSNSDAARMHSVCKRLVQIWRKQESKLRDALSSGKTRFRLEGGGRKYGSIA